MKKCPECGSERIIKAVALVIKNAALEGDVRAAVYEKPNALILKQSVDTDVRAEACGDCGFLQPYLADPKRLWFAYQSGRSNVQ